MTVHTGARFGVCNVLLEDSDLAEALPSARREEIAGSCRVRELWVAPGAWNHHQPDEEGIGMLVMEGLLIRRVGLEGRFGAELLSRGDLLRPWQESTRA
jgi:CRP/FNR family cyclic AMP-dependent transcriptional regulator